MYICRNIEIKKYKKCIVVNMLSEYTMTMFDRILSWLFTSFKFCKKFLTLGSIKSKMYKYWFLYSEVFFDKFYFVGKNIFVFFFLLPHEIQNTSGCIFRRLVCQAKLDFPSSWILFLWYFKSFVKVLFSIVKTTTLVKEELNILKSKRLRARKVIGTMKTFLEYQRNY